jgi:molybdopterin-synthase adenylyltransferase
MLPSQSPAVDYARLAPTLFNRESVRDLRLFVVGAGALGNEVVKTLGLVGVGKISVVDPDVVEPTDLTRSLFLRREGSVGRSKAAALTEVAAEMFPDTIITGLSREIADIGFQELAASNMIFGCVDSDLARLEIAYISTQLDVPVVDAGLATAEYSRGQVSVFPGRHAACFSCRLTGQRRQEMLTIWEAANHPCWLDNGGANRRSYPSTPMMAAVVGAMQVETGLRHLLSGGSMNPLPANVLEIALDPPQRLETFSLTIAASCPFHRPGGARFPSPGPPSSITVRRLLESGTTGTTRGGRATLVLDWPICALARCGQCGNRWSPMTRLASLRTSGACPACGFVISLRRRSFAESKRAASGRIGPCRRSGFRKAIFT